jgi:hypothetical protein
MSEPVQQVREETPAGLDREEGLTTASIAGARPAGDVSPAEQSSEAGAATSTTAEASDRADNATPLFASGETSELRGRWDAIQASFVDEPRKAVENADGLVASAMKRLAEMFSEERAGLEGQWDRGDDVSTEDLRQALRRYRSFFTRLLAV